MSQEQDTAMYDQGGPVEHTGPDCLVGKCDACDGRAWDVDLDDVTDCDCDCHEETL